ncbi:MAG TPA: G1 family glutamic endopeptidase [Streptosporangiaceae bacterium]|nr:G1 family glutamic endopeptidase [Streptosporangiaceae bacterium]
MSRHITRTAHGTLTRIATATVAASLAGAAALSMVLGPVSSEAASASTPTLPRLSSSSAGITSRSWAGYEVQSGTYTSVSASWTQPAIKPAASRHIAVFWVGLDGAQSSTVEQCGTLGQTENGKTTYQAWYEMYPASWVVFSNAPVAPGDHMQATAAYHQGRYSLSVSDHTQGWTHTARKHAAGLARSSAEVIAEAPTVDGNAGPLADFTPVTFSDITVNGAPVNNPIPITMISPAGQTVTSVCGFTGGSFTATPEM